MTENETTPNEAKKTFWDKAVHTFKSYKKESDKFFNIGKIKLDKSFLEKDKQQAFLELGQKTFDLMKAKKLSNTELQAFADKVTEIESKITDFDAKITDLRKKNSDDAEMVSAADIKTDSKSTVNNTTAAKPSVTTSSTSTAKTSTASKTSSSSKSSS